MVAGSLRGDGSQNAVDPRRTAKVGEPAAGWTIPKRIIVLP
jgi:hypothetical protein